MRIRTLCYIVISLSLLTQACRPAKHVEEGKYVVSRAKVKVNPDSKVKFEGDMGDLEASIKQKPYRRLFGVIPFHISVWNFAESRNTDRKFYRYLKETVGEAPTIYEPVLLERSKKQMLSALRNDGYFDAEVSAELKPKGKKMRIEYVVHSNEPYTLRKISYALEDTAIAKEFKGVTRTLFKPNQRFDADLFEDERKRITNYLKNKGYFTFEKIHVIFDVDTNLPGRRFDVSTRLRNLRYPQKVDGKDTVIQQSHERYYIREVVINESFSTKAPKESAMDTTYVKDITFLYRNRPPVRPTRISRNLFVRPGDLYSLNRTNYTYERINSLGNFRFIDMKYTPVNADSNVALLDLRINLTKAPRQAFSIETTGTHRSGNLGISAGINYKNRNLFHGAEQLDMRVYGGLESQRTNSTAANEDSEIIENVGIFNTFEFGAQVSLTIPDFLLRTSRKELPFFKEPKTNISASIDRQFRPQYQRFLINTNYQYTMRIREQDQLIIAPIDLSVIELTKSDFFEQQLQLTNNALLINSYNDHIIPAGRVSYSYSSQDLNNDQKNFHIYRINFESAGNALRGLSGLIGLPYDAEQNSYLINDIAFAQYVKLDLDVVQHVRLTEETKVVYRFFGGIGLPLSNLNVLPFERSFFAGGSNGMRAWRARALGPGGLSETETYGIDQVAESQLEFNVEYRFPLIKQLEGALFTDIGNIWLVSEDEQRPLAEFSPTRFYRELAVAPGAGVRLNFNFFILRLDAGLQLKDPALPVGERWLFQPKDETEALREAQNLVREANGLQPVEEWQEPYRPQFTLNLAIGYPF